MAPQFVKAAKAGDNVAWNFLYKQHYPWMYATALHICRNIPDAKDAVQEAFVTAYLKLQQLKDTAAFAGWLKTILIRVCRRNKQQQLYKNINNDISPENDLPPVDEINGKMDWYDRQSKIYTSLSELPDALQSVLLFRYFSNCTSYQEIASMLCIPVGTVRSRLNQARQKLAEEWAKADDDTDTAFRTSTEWNAFYREYFSKVYSSVYYRDKLIGHFDKDLHIVFSSSKSAYGRKVIAKEIEDDLLHGSSFSDVYVISSGNISIVEVCNLNSREYPNRCPDSGVFVLYRQKNRINRINFHNLR